LLTLRATPVITRPAKSAWINKALSESCSSAIAICSTGGAHAAIAMLVKARIDAKTVIRFISLSFLE
jgi:hypothetical protein